MAKSTTRWCRGHQLGQLLYLSVFFCCLSSFGHPSIPSFQRLAMTTNGLKQTPLTCSGHTRPVVHVSFSDITPDGYFLVSACKDGKPMLRQGETGDWIGTFEGHKGAVWGVALNGPATRVATGSGDFTAKLWDCESGDELSSITHPHIVRTVDFSHLNSTNLLMTGSQDKLLRIYDLNSISSGAVLTCKGHLSSVRHALFTSDDRKLISASDDKTIRIWDRNSGEEIQAIDFPAIPSSIELTRDGSILSVSSGSKVSFWQVEGQLTKVKEFNIPTQVLSSTLHPSKQVFVCGGEDFKMYKCSYEDGAEIESFKGHFGPVHCVRFSPDGELYASGSEDGTLRLWQTQVGKTYGLWKCVMPDVDGDRIDGDQKD